MPIYFNSAPTDFPFQFDSIGNNWNQEPTLRPDGFPVYHYLQTQEGSGILSIDEKKYTIGENQGVLLAPGIPHVYHSASGQWITLFATFSGSMSPYFSALFGSSHLLFFENEKAASIRKLIDQAILHHQETPTDPQLLSQECYQVLLQFIGGLQSNPSQQPAWEKYVRPVLTIIHTRYMEDLTADALSQKVFVTPQYLSRLFSRYLGCSVYEYLTKFRISKAKELLVSHRTRKIQDISQDVGYTDASHFVLMFRKTTGMTPSEFRKIN
ncbi:helix-turn-helix domain-containing protein [Blautia sp. MCC289]|nr:helix-turn-helix domain-containing protein [Blautia sp. MCC289]MCC2240110.1 helix-turn-helix transcriptional regulator [Fusicatenibacter sp. CLA-AA-H213]